MINKNSFPNIPDFNEYFQDVKYCLFYTFYDKKAFFPKHSRLLLIFKMLNMVFFILFIINKSSFPNSSDFY